MTIRAVFIAVLALGWQASATQAIAQPSVQNAKLETKAAGNLAATIRSLTSTTDAPIWIAYAVKAMPGHRDMCCWTNDCRGCTLEGRAAFHGVPSGDNKVYLEGQPTVYVFLRTVQGRVETIRTFTPDCGIDAGGAAFYWLTGADDAQSIQYLRSFVNADPKADKVLQRLASSAIAAIAMHKNTAAERVLEELTRSTGPESVRRDAMSWLARARGKEGLDYIESILTK